MSLNVDSPVAHNDIGCMLFAYDSTSAKFKYLVPVRAIPATQSAPSTIEVTEMDSAVKQYIPDRPDIPSYEFDYNYTKAKYAAVKAVCDGKTATEFLIVYSDASGCRFTGTGFTWRDAVSVGGEIKGKITIVVSKTDDVDDCTSIVDTDSIPADRVSPFAE